MTNYYRAVREVLGEMYQDNPAIYLLEDLAPRFRPPRVTMYEWKHETINALIKSFRFYRYQVEEDREMAIFLAYRDAVEYQFQHGVWRKDDIERLRLTQGDLEKRLLNPPLHDGTAYDEDDDEAMP